MKNNKIKGELGEKVARKFAKNSLNIEILENNFHSRFGEIDIIGQDKISKELVFIEVRSHMKEQNYEPYETINNKKLSKIFTSCLSFLKDNSNTISFNDWRIDIASIKRASNGKYSIKWFKNINCATQ